MGRPKSLVNVMAPPASNTNFTAGAKSKGILDDFAVRKVINTKEAYTNSIQFNIDYSDGQAEGRLQWSEEDGTLEIGMPGGVVNLQIGQEQLMKAKNTSGVNILNGQPVRISGGNGAFPTIELANATDITSGVIGIATEDIDDNKFGLVNVGGLVRNIDTSSWVAGTSLFLAESDGGITNIPPTTTSRKVFLGVVTRQSATEGVLYVNIVNVSFLTELSDGGSHDIAFHSDTTATGAELDTLTDNSIADTLHRHSELVASDGSPDPALIVDIDGKVGINTTNTPETLNIEGTMLVGDTSAPNAFGATLAVVETGPAQETGTDQGFVAEKEITSGTGSGSAFAIAGSIFANGGQFSNCIAVDSIVRSHNDSNIPVATALRGFALTTGTGIIDVASGIQSEVRVFGPGSINKGVGIFIKQIDGTENWGLYQENSANQNFFAGPVGIGIDTPDEKLTIDNGTLLFQNGGGLCFGEIYAQDNTTETAITTAGKVNKVQVAIFNTNGHSNNTSPDHTNNHITITKAGKYMVNISMSVESIAGDSDKLGFSLYKNDGTTEFPNIHFHRDFTSGAAKTGSASMNGIIDCAVNDTIELWGWNENDTDNFLIEDITISLFQIGG